MQALNDSGEVIHCDLCGEPMEEYCADTANGLSDWVVCRNYEGHIDEQEKERKMGKSKNKRRRTAGQRAATQGPSIEEVADQMNAEDTAVVDDGYPDVPPDVPPEEVAIEEEVVGEPTAPDIPEEWKPGQEISDPAELDAMLDKAVSDVTLTPIIKRCRVFDATPAPECFEVGRRDSDHSGVTLPPRIVTSITRMGNDTHITFETNGVKSRSVLVNVPVELQYEDTKGGE